MYKRIRSFIVNLISLPLYWFSFLIPRDKKIWVFGAWFGRSYTDNSKWLFESVCKNEPQIRAVWLTRERRVVEEVRRYGFEAHMINSLKGYWFSCRAGLVTACCGNADINRLAISRAKRIQLWHGSPMKKIGKDDKFTQIDPSSFSGLLQKIWHTVFPFTTERWDIVIALSDVFKEYMASAFGLDSSQVKVTGYPRNDILLYHKPPIIPYVEKIKQTVGAKSVILYAPTHRGEGRRTFDLISTLDIVNTDKILTANNAILLIKMHHYHQDHNPDISLDNTLSRIIWLRKEDIPEINPLLNYTDILITDYSSVYFDYLLLDRPVIFAPFDLEHYLAGDREMYDDYEKFATAGPMCKNWNEVMAECQKVLEGNDQYREERKAAQKKFNTFVDANSCSRVIEVAKNILGIR